MSYCTVTTACKNRICCICAVNLCNLLRLKHLSSAAEICSAQTQFSANSPNRVINCCVGAINGLFVVIKWPSMKDSTSNPSSYVIGKYCCCGLNNQPFCKTPCQSNFFVAGPWKPSDKAATEQTGFSASLGGLLLGSHVGGDAKYTLSDNKIALFTDSQ